MSNKTGTNPVTLERQAQRELVEREVNEIDVSQIDEEIARLQANDEVYETQYKEAQAKEYEAQKWTEEVYAGQRRNMVKLSMLIDRKRILEAANEAIARANASPELKKF